MDRSGQLKALLEAQLGGAQEETATKIIETQRQLDLDEAFDGRPFNHTDEMCELVGLSEQRRMAAAERYKYKTDLERAKTECKEWQAQYVNKSQRHDDDHRIHRQLRELMKGAGLRRDAQHAARSLQGEGCGS